MIFHGRKMLFLGAHPDDIELGCGALLAHVAGKAEVLCVTLSDNRHNPALSGLVEEHYRSMAVLGVAKDKVMLRDFETRNFPRDRQQILELLYGLNRSERPDIVFTHSQADMHQDHNVVTEETLRAFRGTTVLGYDVIRSSHGFFPHFLVEVDPDDVDRKVRALAEYRTYAGKYYFQEDLTRATLIRNGALAERPFAEGFDILRIVAGHEVLAGKAGS
ncbi:MAG TPA: PIG-L family deacetylase [Anaerolineales bacterium]|nr:PIG-L family deacetylase [Anaerolineales bacterium]